MHLAGWEGSLQLGRVFNGVLRIYNLTMTEKLLDKIIRPEYRAKLEDWTQYIKESELIGL